MRTGTAPQEALSLDLAAGLFSEKKLRSKLSGRYTARCNSYEAQQFNQPQLQERYMGYFMKEHDIHVGSLLDQLNVRFGPTPDKKTHFGGIDEMVALQKEFKLFKKGRSFKSSIAVLNIGASHSEARNRMHDYFTNLSKHDSNVPSQNGDVAIVNALVRNLASKTPLPVYFTFHDMRAEKGNTRVLISENDRPVTYFNRDYLTISFPTMPEKSAKPAAKPVAKSTKK
jgi:hypothetical protein